MNRAFAILALGALAACTHHVDVELRPDYPTGVKESVLTSVRPAVSFARGGYADKRGDTTMLATFKQGVHTYNLFGQRPASDALFEGVQILVERAGHTWVPGDSGQVRIDLQLLGMEANRNAGLFEVGASSKVQIKLDFVDRATGRLIYSDVYNGADQRSKALIGGMGMVKASLDGSIINCINQVGADSRLVDALRQWVQAPRP